MYCRIKSRIFPFWVSSQPRLPKVDSELHHQSNTASNSTSGTIFCVKRKVIYSEMFDNQCINIIQVLQSIPKDHHKYRCAITYSLFSTRLAQSSPTLSPSTTTTPLPLPTRSSLSHQCSFFSTCSASLSLSASPP